ncbi:MAG TPA: hypothetical protein VH682_08180 [Gemmataceae bacterium]|jgi:hypothetical protein
MNGIAWRNTVVRQQFAWALFLALAASAFALPVACSSEQQLAPAEEAPLRKPATPAKSTARKPQPPGRTLASILEYVGAFRFPGDKVGASTFASGGTAIAFNPVNNSLFVIGHDRDQAVAEAKIPDTVVNSKKLSDLPTAKVLQPFVRILSRIPHFPLEGNVKIGGLLVVDGKLIGTAYVYYDGDGKAVKSHFRLDSLNLSSAKVEGLFQVGKLGGGFVGGYMTAIPNEWQADLGAPYMTGLSATNIHGRTSSGPAAFGFNPAQLSMKAAAPVTPYLYYPLKHQTLGATNSTNPVWNGTTEITGVFFVPGSRSVLFFGSHGVGKYFYGEAAAANDPNRGGKGDHSVNGKYAYQVWAYNVDDFVAVKKGKKQPWQIKPYDVWNLDFPHPEGSKHIGGVAFDPATGRLYVSQMFAARIGYDYAPLIQVFKLR